MPMCGHVPSAAAVIVTLKALRAQGGSPDGPIELGFPNLARHLDNLALGRAAGGRAQPIPRRHRRRSRPGAEVTAARSAPRRRLRGLHQGRRRHDGRSPRRSSRPRPRPIREQVKPIYTDRPKPRREDHRGRHAGLRCGERRRSSRRRSRGSRSSRRSATASCRCASPRRSIRLPTIRSSWARRSGWTLTISDVSLSAGAGFVVAIAGSMMLMPGLGKVPQAQKLDVDDQGRAIGMEY